VDNESWVALFTWVEIVGAGLVVIGLLGGSYFERTWGAHERVIVRRS
jgi:hypothetical protein